MSLTRMRLHEVTTTKHSVALAPEEAKRVASLPEQLHDLIMKQVKDSQQRWQAFPSQANMYYGSEAVGCFITFVYDGAESRVSIKTALLEKYQDDG